MTCERLLQICVAAMASLATLMLGTSQNNVMLPVAAVAAAILSLCFTDILGWFHLHRFLAGIAGVAAGMNALFQSQDSGLEGQFISVANLLIHLQIILLFQQKNERIYWQLITLSLLQVVVAAALNLFFLFGPLLVLYTGFAISAMLLFYIWRETLPFVTTTTGPVDSRALVRLESWDAGPSGTQQKQRPRQELLHGSFFRYFGVLSMSTVLVSAIVFLFMPRYGDGVWQAKSTVAQTGFSGGVDLEDSGSIYESPTLVMRVSFVSEATGEPYALTDEPYFRGAVLRHYVRGSWKRGGGDLDTETMGRLPSAARITSVVRQVMSFERERNSVVFSVAPACATAATPRQVQVDPETAEMLYEVPSGEDPTQYSLGTLGLVNGMQSQFAPDTGDRFRYDIRTASIREDFPDLTAAAAEIVQAIPADDILGRARALEAHFTGGGRYKYSLDPSPDRNPDIDPVVDFALNHRSGHCQHFASALALMLRSQGIRARVVVGYRGGIFNYVGNYYQLREMDAHAWVEAGIPADQVPQDEILPAEGLEGDAWMRLDPTPGSGFSTNSVAVSPWRQQFNDTVDYMQLLWSEYVLGLNEKRQRKAIYEPIKQALRNFANLLFSRDVWVARWEQLMAQFQGDFWARANARDTVLAVALLTVLFYVVRFVARWLWRTVRSWMGRRRGGYRPRVEFYRRFERHLAKLGIRRAPTQTHREFAAAAQHHLASLSTDAAVLAIPQQVVETFYRVRFGRDPLDSEDSERVENWLQVLKRVTQSKRPTLPSTGNGAESSGSSQT